MEFSELAKRRYSVRSYNGKKVEQEKVEKILEAAHARTTAKHGYVPLTKSRPVTLMPPSSRTI